METQDDLWLGKTARNGKDLREITDPNVGIDPVHRQIVMMHLAGMSQPAIARFLDCTSEYIGQVLLRPRVQRYTLMLQASYMNDLRPIAERVNKSIEDQSERAAQVVSEIMEEMHKKEDIRAKSLALCSAKDILDRAGHRPTVKVESKNLHGHVVSEGTMEKMAEVLREMKAPPPRAVEE
jgi:hypothetical protein